MSAKHSQFAACAIADATIMTPVYATLSHLQVSGMQSEQTLKRNSVVGGDAFASYAITGERDVRVTLNGLSDGSAGEQLLRSGLLTGALRLLHFDTAQGQRLSGAFWVTKFSQEANGDRFETINAQLQSQGAVTFA